MVLMGLFAEKEWRLRHREWICGHSWRKKGWDKLKEQHRNVYKTMCKTTKLVGS